MHDDYGVGKQSNSIHSTLTHTTQHHKKQKLTVVSSELPYQRKKIFSFSNSNLRKGLSISKNVGKTIDKLYKHDDWNNQERKPYSPHQEYMLKVKIKSPERIISAQHHPQQKHSISSSDSYYSFGKGTFDSNLSTKSSSKTRGFLFIGSSIKPSFI